MTSEYQQIKQFFDENKIPYSKDWLDSCLDFCINHNLPPNYSINDLKSIVFQQWLYLDLRILEVPSLPSSLPKELKYSLNGNYYLQVVQVIDISKPKLWQIHRIRNKTGKNAEPDNDYGKRVLQLTLTDGVGNIEAMEFKPIQCLNINLPPGIKIKIRGPVMVRNGRLMLEDTNVKILGGHVEEDKVQYAAENVLARALGLPENADPITIDENILEINESILNTQAKKTIQNPVQNKHQSKVLSNKNVLKSRTPEIPPDFEVDDELLNELQCEEFNEDKIKSNYRDNKRKPTCKSPDLFKENDIDEELLNEHWNQLDESLELIEKPIVSKEVTKKDVSNIDDTFEDIDIDSHLDKIDEEMAKLPSSTQISVSPKLKRLRTDLDSPDIKPASKKMAQSKINFGKLNCEKYKQNMHLRNSIDDDDASAIVNTSPEIKVMTIEKLKKILPNIGMGKFKIRAKFSKVVQKMVIKDKLYNLVIKVEDSSGDLVVRVLSDVVQGFVGISPEKMEDLKGLVYKNDEVAKEQVISFLRKIHQACISLNDIVEIHIIRGEDYPVLANIINH
ncbi:uncharacterized protein LOC143196400 isoform X2 [Rhynchophorus ferrugineus]|uniref:uncharacterized protein LOC143196400 isoform X2 n=1 Tax=Rhynchophorus ferrugineus TaxID=354439 RepID=UPI003FCDF7D7